MDDLGRDVLSRILHAVRMDLHIAFIAVLIPFVLGTAMGLLAGYFGRSGGRDRELGGRTSSSRSRSTSSFISLVFVLGTGARWNIYIAIALVGWVSYTRIVRGEVARRERLRVRACCAAQPALADDAHHQPAHASERDHAGDRLRDVRHRPRHPRHRHAQLPRPGRAAADARLGRDDRRRSAVPDHPTWELATIPGFASSSPPSGCRCSATASPTSCDPNDRDERSSTVRDLHVRVPARARPRAGRRRRLLRPAARRGPRPRRRIRLREDDGAARARRPASMPGAPRGRRDPLRGRQTLAAVSAEDLRVDAAARSP